MHLVQSKAFLILLAFVSTSVAGCVGGTDDVATPGTTTDEAQMLVDRLLADVAGLPCEPNYTRGQTSPNFMEITHLETDDVRYGEIDVIDNTDLVVFARYASGGFDIYNVSNPYDPEHVVGFELDSYSLDIKVSGDGKTLLSGDFGRFEVVDISDPSAPVVEGYVDFPQEAKSTQAQAHMIHMATINEEEYAFFGSQYGQGVLIYHMAGEPGAREFHFLGYFAPAIGGPLAAHDMMVYHDPIANIPILWVANGFGGFIAADVSDPATPVIVSYSPEPDPYQGWVHTVSVTHLDEQRILVTISEIGAMALKVYDVTTLAVPILLGTWTLDTNPMATQHNTQIMDKWLWMGHYGNGVVKFDLVDIVTNQTKTLPAYNIGPLVEPLGGGIAPFAQYLPAAGSAWESVIVNGVHWTTAGGIYGTLDGCHDPTDKGLRAYV